MPPRIACDRSGELPALDEQDFDLFLTSVADPPAPWVSLPPNRFDTHCALLERAIRANPIAASGLCEVLRRVEELPFDEGLEVESLAYSGLLGGAEFKRWLAVRADQTVHPARGALVGIEREGDQVTISLADPANRNGISAAMRDALFDALVNVLEDPTCPKVTLCGDGACFSIGGVLAEFGTATDLALAHRIRMERSCARLIHQLGERIEVRFHGAVIGSGLEIGAAAARRLAAPDSWFHLPELAMGLIPGAGGTVSVARAIGRQRAAWMVLSGKRLRAETALQWGLVTEIQGLS